MTGWWRERWLRSGNGERALLALGVLSVVFAGLLTWDLVVYRGTAVELTEGWARLFAEWGAWGVVFMGALKLTGFLLLWGIWPPLSVILCTAFVVDLLHDLLFWAFGSDLLFPLLGAPEVVLGFVLAFLLVRLRWIGA
ncbi:MAG: hypothetical protein QXM46_02395 [Candidatus Hadarchaeales archaeon]